MSEGLPVQEPELAVTPAATPEQWAESFSLALDDHQTGAILRVALHTHLTSTSDTDVQDACLAGLDLLRRWQRAQQVGGFEADILLHDYRPIRPYARSIGVAIGERLAQAEVSRG